MQTKTIFFIGLIIVSIAVSSAKATTPEEEYEACLLLVRDKPADALASSREWQKQSGGDPARHCEAVALTQLGRFDEAAILFEAVAKNQPVTKAKIATSLYSLAAQAYLQIDKPAMALAALNQGLKLLPNDADLLIDRATYYGSNGKFYEALDDLNHARDQDPRRVDVYILAASAYRSLKEYDLAKDELELAFNITKDDPYAYLERGLLRQTQGDASGAKEDFELTVKLAPGTAVADAAKHHLEALAQNP